MTAPAAVVGSAGRARRRFASAVASTAASRLVVLVALIASFGALEPHFLSADAAAVALRWMSYVGIIAAGQTILIIAGEFDLSVGAVAGLSGLVCALLMTSWGVDPLAAAILTGLIGAVIGLANGLLAVRFGIPSFIVTLGMLYIARGLGSFLTGGRPVHPLPEVVGQFGSIQPFGLSIAFFVMLAVMAGGELFLRRTIPGRTVFAVGGNPEVARIIGIATARVKIGAFIFVGFLSAVAGMFAMAEFASAQQTTGTGWELLIIAAVVIGGTSLFGGSGSIIGTLLGLLILQVVSVGLVFARIDLWWQTLLIGVVMIASMAIDRLRGRSG
jgi:ribose transport system permease protein